jgi:hypothetical protein
MSTMKTVSHVIAIAFGLFTVGCIHIESPVPHSVGAGSRTARIKESDLHGVWEVVSCRAINPSPRVAKSTLNYKYCFNSETAYPRLSPDSASDSADGGGEYHLVGDDILVIRTGVPGGMEAYEIQLSDDKLILFDPNYRTTLRRIAKTWDGKAPIIKPRDILITR